MRGGLYSFPILTRNILHSISTTPRWLFGSAIADVSKTSSKIYLHHVVEHDDLGLVNHNIWRSWRVGHSMFPFLLLLHDFLRSTTYHPRKYFFLKAIYNIYFHPLSHIPGPRLWTASRLPFISALIRGSISHDVRKFHQKYGNVVRIAPDEVTFSSPSAWDDILNRADKKVFLKDHIWWKEVPGLPGQILSAIDPERHARMRKLIMPGFTTGALREQEPILQLYTNLLVERLTERAEEIPQGCAELDIGPWMNFTTFDIFGDLGFGESFECLEQSKYHPWVALIFNSVRATSWIAATRFYPVLEQLIQKLMPPSAKKMTHDHFRQIAEKVDRRLNWELQRPDLMSQVIKQDYEKKGMTRAELNSNFMMLTTVGSETSATTLTGAFNYLVRNPEKLEIAVGEVRDKFKGRHDMTLDALRDMPYLNATLHEALRLCPPVPWILPRRVSEGGAEVCGIWLPGNVRVSFIASSEFELIL